MRTGPFHLGYCTNVHPGERLEDVRATIAGPVAAVRRRVSPDGPFGLGLRLGDEVVRALVEPSLRDAFIELLKAQDMYVFTMNAFPFGDFAAPVVKQAVYAPDWRSEARVEYTVRVAELLTRLPGPMQRTISTVAGGFRPETEDRASQAQMAENLARTAQTLARLADATGVSVRLCLEPEPWTTIETTDEAIAFFHGHKSLRTAEARAHLGLCYDCCHQAVQFEDATASVKALVAAEVAIGKVQVSSALHLAKPADAQARAALLAFAEPRYLHQVVAQAADGTLLRVSDLPKLVDAPDAWTAAQAWRCHFHVPIFWDGDGTLGTTRADWQAALRAVQAAGACDHLEIETYTWHVLPETERAALEGGDLVASIAAEFAAVQAVIAPEVGR
ncbi:MAG: metabolite traffic protein EboE [Myxococcales bacterium]|nr:metabolite traffic protein EboE [Myxococcales bacterium]